MSIGEFGEIIGQWIVYIIDIYKSRLCRYRKRTVYVVTKNEKSLVGTDNDDGDKLHMIRTLSVSPQSKILMCVVEKAQLFWAPIIEKVTDTADMQNEVTTSTYLTVYDSEPCSVNT